MKIAVIGAGSVGGALGKAWAKAGHGVVFGVRDAGDDKVRNLLAEAGASASAAEVADAPAHAEVVLLATPWPAVPQVIAQCNGFQGKVLVDATNPLGPGLALTVGLTDSGGEQVARLAPEAKVVKCFNTTGANNMEDPDYGGVKPTMLYAGDNAEAKQTVARLAGDVGFDPIDAGPLANARLLEPYAALWIDLAMKRGIGREIAFVLHRRTR